LASDYYSLLVIKPDATAEAIKSAFRGLAKALHPDVNSAADAGEQFARVQRAYATLSDPAKRRTYDRRRSGEGPGRAAADGAARPRPTGGHYTWQNVAAPGGAGGRGGGGGPGGGSMGMDPASFDELWEALFEPRVNRRG
jgi:molecular chaperone DnaJ